jgi:hypothetical protein
MKSGPGRASIAAGALQELHHAIVITAKGVDLMIDHYIWIFKLHV